MNIILSSLLVHSDHLYSTLYPCTICVFSIKTHPQYPLYISRIATYILFDCMCMYIIYIPCYTNVANNASHNLAIEWEATFHCMRKLFMKLHMQRKVKINSIIEKKISREGEGNEKQVSAHDGSHKPVSRDSLCILHMMHTKTSVFFLHTAY